MISTLSEVKEYFQKDKKFILGLGGTKERKILYDKLFSAGGELTKLVSDKAVIGSFDVIINEGVVVMPMALVSNSVIIGKGTLIDSNASVHHDAKVGVYCNLSPGSTILGGTMIGNYSMIGSNATILPDIEIGNNVVIGAGAVVTKNIPDNSLAFGVPAKVIKVL